MRKLLTIILVIAIAVTSFLVPGKAMAQEEPQPSEVVEMRLVEESSPQQSTSPQSPDAGQCAIGIPFGPPGWLVGVLCVVVSAAGVVAVLGVTAIVLDGSGQQHRFYGETKVEDSGAPLTVWSVPGYGNFTTQADARMTVGQDADIYTLVTQPALARLKDPTREDEDPRADYEPHWGGTRHPEADTVYQNIFNATNGGYKEPDGPNEKWKCLMSLAYKLPEQNGLQNAWSHTRYAMFYDDGARSQVLIWGEVYKAVRQGGGWRFINVGSKNFLITAYYVDGGWNRALARAGQLIWEGWKACGPNDHPPLPPLSFAMEPGVCVTTRITNQPEQNYCPNPDWVPICRAVLVNNDPPGWRSYWPPSSEALEGSNPPPDWAFQTQNLAWPGPLPWICPFSLFVPVLGNRTSPPSTGDPLR